VSSAVLIIFTVLALAGYPIRRDRDPGPIGLGRWRWAAGGCRVDGGPEQLRQALFRSLSGGFRGFLDFARRPAVTLQPVVTQGKTHRDVFAGTW